MPPFTTQGASLKGMKMTNGFRKSLLATTIFTGVGLVAAPAFAQTTDVDAAQTQATGDAAEAAEETQSQQEIVVTGTLIRNPNLEASSPVNVVSEEEIELQQANVAEELLRELPGAVPSIGSAVNNGNGGASFVNLRNLGSNRNLVLIDGVRLVPAELLGRFDLNNIPLALIQRVDVLTGGATTTYGADAVAGVVNFITRQNFEGMEATASQQITEEGDGNVFRADLTLGANFADDRGNAVLGLSYQEADPVYQGGRDFGLFAISSSTGAGGGSGTAVPSRFSLPGVGTRQVNAEGTAFQPTAAFTPFNFNPYNVYQTPFERYNVYGAARYEVTDDIEVYGRGIYSKNTVETIIAPSGAFGLAVQVPLNNPFLTPALRNSFCSANGISAADCAAAANPALTPGAAGYREVTTQLSRRAVEVGPRISEYRTNFFDIRAGIRGSLTDTIDWDLFGSHGESDNLQVIQGYTLNSRVRASLRANNTSSCFSGAPAGCVPINWFGPAFNSTWTPEAIDFLNDNSTVGTNVRMSQARATISGDFGWSAPWATDAVGFAVGGEYRKYRASQGSDSLAQSGDLGGAGGASPNIDGGFSVREAFGELILPIVQDRPFFHDLTVEAGGRYSDYKVDAPGEPTFDTWTWKVGGSWSPVEALKFRGNYARAVRAPNISELFSPLNTVLTNLNDDPCAQLEDNGNRTRPVPTGTLRDVCLAQGATAATIGTIPQPTAGQANTTTGGNLALRPEKATSWTVGAVFDPDFVPGLTLSVDYYNIKVTGAISNPTTDDVITACFGEPSGSGARPTYNPAAGAATSEACTIIRRNPLTGSLAGDPSDTPGLYQPLSNLGTIRTSGVDFTAGYQRDLGFAGLDLNFVLNWVDESRFQATPTSEDRECVRFYSANCMPPQPEWQWSARSTFSFGETDVSVLWRHLSALKYEPGIGTLFEGTLPASAGPVAGREVNFNRIPAYDYFDVTTRFDVTDNMNLILSVQNLFDKEPPLVGGEAGSTTFNSGNTFPSTYDALGRRFVATAKLRF